MVSDWMENRCEIIAPKKKDGEQIHTGMIGYCSTSWIDFGQKKINMFRGENSPTITNSNNKTVVLLVSLPFSRVFLRLFTEVSPTSSNPSSRRRMFACCLLPVAGPGPIHDAIVLDESTHSGNSPPTHSHSH